jgi:hypothetical protein
MKEYVLRLNERQAEIVSRALDLYSRIGIGQFEEIVTIYEASQWDAENPPTSGKVQEARRYVQDAKFALTGFQTNASHSIVSEKVNDAFRVAWDVCKVIRHRIAWDKSPGGGHGVNFDEPYQTSKEALPKIESV